MTVPPDDPPLDGGQTEVVEYVSWFNHEWLHESLGDIPPVESEDLYVRRGAQLSYPS